MSRKYIFLTIVVMVFLLSMLVGCSSTPAETTPAPDTSIVWSDDFEDGDTEGWVDCINSPPAPDDYSVRDGALTFNADGVCLRYPSTVNVGTWSADILIPDRTGTTNDITFIASQGDAEMEWSTMWMTIEHLPNTVIALYDSGEYSPNFHGVSTIGENGKITGWHHVDITRDESGNMKIYFDGELQIDNVVDYPYESDYFVAFFYEGSGIDNIVVRNQVIDIQPPSE
jgi:hypothetical protein